jgi:hypothetical protein
VKGIGKPAYLTSPRETLGPNFFEIFELLFLRINCMKLSLSLRKLMRCRDFLEADVVPVSSGFRFSVSGL